MHAGGVDEDFAELSAFMGAMTASSVNWELGVRLNQSLEITHGLWELVPLVAHQVKPLMIARRQNWRICHRRHAVLMMRRGHGSAAWGTLTWP